MNATVIRVEPGESGLRLSLHDAPINIQADPKNLALSCAPTDAVFVRFQGGAATDAEVGEALMTALANHPAVDEALTAALGAVAGEERPIYFYLTPEAEALPWETLRRNGTFLTLDRRWPIARMGRRAPGNRSARSFVPPLRFMAILAAAKVDASGEWDAIWNALTHAPFAVDLCVLVAQPELLRTIEAASATNVNVSAGYLPPDRDVFEHFRKFQPHVLHFFCHGEADASFSRIELATRSGWRKPDDGAGIVQIEATQFVSELFLPSLWMLTLNCCKGAQGTGSGPGVGSLAYSLVAQGFPAVAGMREAVSVDAANAFCLEFYRAVLTLLDGAMTASGETEIEWASALYPPRQRLSRRGAAERLAWTLPVMYVRPDPFIVRGSAVIAGRPGPVPKESNALTGPQRVAIETELDVLRRLVAEPLGTPPEALELYKQRIHELEHRLQATEPQPNVPG